MFEMEEEGREETEKEECFMGRQSRKVVVKG
jgi:hypothetical protein